ncbi:heme ABC exporter ATP-binding protein CcmA [Rhodovibrionaceae bacterium A322]
MATFAAENLGCIRGERAVFSNLSFSLESGGLMLLHGKNGSGKSSLLRVLAGLIDFNAGELYWNGEALNRDFSAHHAAVTYVGHQDVIKPQLTVEENLTFWARLHGNGPDKVSAALDAFDLTFLAQQPGRLLSSGQRRRLALSRILVIPAELWLLDEPTVGLDQASIERLSAVLTDHRKAGGMAILATHVDIDQPDMSQLNLNEFQVALSSLQEDHEDLDAALDKELGW